MAKKKKFKIPNPDLQLQELKIGEYKFGEKTNNLFEIKKDKPIFSFRFASIQSGKFCFDSNKIDGVKDYISLIKGIKKISGLTYDTLSRNRQFHFHEVDFKDVTMKESDFVKCITNNPTNADTEQTPTLYQVKVFRESRILGFFYSKIFHLVFFDVNHDLYKRN